MATASELLKIGKTRDLWEKYCGFIDLNVEEFLEIQKRLLLEQLPLLNNCEMTKSIMGGVQPTSVEEFREQVPFTTYEAYLPYLQDKIEDVLPERPLLWIRTSGRSGEYPCKWVPITEGFLEEIGKYCVACLTFATCKGKYDIAYEDHFKCFYAMAPPPFPSGAYAMAIRGEFALDFVPAPEEAEGLDFNARIRSGVNQSLSGGIDFIFGLSSVLAAIGARFAERSGGADVASLLKQPKAVMRLMKGMLRSRLARRPMMPKDLWNITGIAGAGMDTTVLKDRIKHYWGKYPLELYACAEVGLVAVQTWDYGDMVLIPTMAFLEFIPEEERNKSKKKKGYKPRTVLLNEVEVGKRYELVISSYYGVPFIRYRIGDMIQVNALRNPTLNIELPQITVHGRCDDVIDIGGFTRLTEKILWQAVEDSGVAYRDWVVRKEAGDNITLHLYLEPKDSHITPEETELRINIKLLELDSDYKDAREILGYYPLKVTLLPQGAFQRYADKQQAAGADLAHLKPPHLNVSDEVLSVLTNTG
jgi:hypothetical protein